MNEKKERQLLRYKNFFWILDEWMTLKENGRDIGDILEACGYRKIAVYGMGRLCRHICSALSESAVRILYIIDVNSCELYEDFHIVNLDYDFAEVDAVICTDMPADDITEILKDKFPCKIINLLDVVFDNIPE